jgi:hypothetical protein
LQGKKSPFQAIFGGFMREAQQTASPAMLGNALFLRRCSGTFCQFWSRSCGTMPEWMPPQSPYPGWHWTLVRNVVALKSRIISAQSLKKF